MVRPDRVQDQTLHQQPREGQLPDAEVYEPSQDCSQSQVISYCRYARIWPKPFIKRSNNDEVSRQLWFVGLQFYDEVLDISGQALEMNR